MRLKSALFLAGAMLVTSSSDASFAATSETDAFVSQSVTIHATPKTVWHALQKHRKVTPGRNLLSYNGSNATIKETFEDLPVIGDAQLTYVEHEIPLSRIEYKLVQSNKLKAFEGTWQLSPSDNGQSTILQLSSRTDTGLQLPFAETITKKATLKNVKKRLSEIKQMAESIAKTGSDA